MRVDDIRIKTIGHKKKKYKCECIINEETEERCGKEAGAKIVIKSKWLNIKEKNKTVSYMCEDCFTRLLKEALEND